MIKNLFHYLVVILSLSELSKMINVILTLAPFSMLLLDILFTGNRRLILPIAIFTHLDALSFLIFCAETGKNLL